MSLMGVIDKHLESLSKRSKENEFLLISASEVMDILLDIRSSVGTAELVLDGDELTKLVANYAERKIAKNGEK